MSHSSKNYSTDGGDTLVIGGKLKVDGGTVEGIVAAVSEYTDTKARDAIKTKAQIAALVSPSADYANLAAATAAIKSIVDALKA